MPPDEEPLLDELELEDDELLELDEEDELLEEDELDDELLELEELELLASVVTAIAGLRAERFPTLS